MARTILKAKASVTSASLQTYSVEIGPAGAKCSCLAARYGGRGATCKHVRALFAMLGTAMRHNVMVQAERKRELSNQAAEIQTALDEIGPDGGAAAEVVA